MENNVYYFDDFASNRYLELSFPKGAVNLKEVESHIRDSIVEHLVDIDFGDYEDNDTVMVYIDCEDYQVIKAMKNALNSVYLKYKI